MVRNSNETLSRYIDSLLTKPRLRKGTRGELQDREATKEQLDVLRRYYKYLKFEKKVKITTISSYLSTIRFFIVETGKRFEDITKEDIQNYFEHTDSNSEYTKQRVRNALKQFFKWLYNTPKDEYPDVVDWITVGKFRKYLSPDDLLTEDEVLRILNACDNPRDRALISLLFDSAMRVTEVSNLDLKDLKVNDNHAIVFIRQAKTSSGTREVPIVNAVPALKNWLSHHPYKDNPEAPLFISLGNRNYGQRLFKDGIEQAVGRLRKRAGIKKRVYPHLFRHSKLTQLVIKGLQESKLRRFAGWSLTSDAPQFYIHLSGKNITDSILELEGVVSKEEKTDKLKTVKCLRCGEGNSATFLYCWKCGTSLDKDSQDEIEYMLKWQEFIKRHGKELKAMMDRDILGQN